MFCMNCGKELPDDANFCLKCGKPQNASALAEVEEPVWETCEIVWNYKKKGGMLSNDKLMFWAKAIGPKGEYNAGESEG